ncbi:unnamed protein product [Haemonchus placei]|uniref:Uncharacterized protein n=1 Tax=Haemonchus placei TaxID=6290 RepID=A0A0N4X4D4_HAEPC|nr:unnamed protein product [Haemonchus placei]
MPSFDYGAIACVSELLFNRTYLGQNDHPLNMTFYETLPTVRSFTLFSTSSEIFSIIVNSNQALLEADLDNCNK